MLLTSFALPLQVYAGPAATAQPSCATLSSDDPPVLGQIVCPIARVFNVMVFAAGVILTVMLAYGGIKITSALGDPKGMEAGKQTLTYAVIGVACVTGVFVILNVIMSLFGLEYGVTSVFANLQTAINRIGTGLGVYR